MKKNIFLSLLLLTNLFGQAQITSLNHTSESKKQLSDNSGYDVIKYRLEYFSDPKSNEFSGKTTVYFKALNILNQIILDAGNNLNIKEIIYRKQSITDYIHENEKLKINLPSTLVQNSTDSVSISFSGDSELSKGYFAESYTDKQDKEHFVTYTFSEQFEAPPTWWVCKDGLADKADQIEFIITHPSLYKAIANGKLISITDNKNGTTTTTWNHTYPIPTYAIGLAIAEYEEYHQTIQIGETLMPILNFLYPESMQSGSGAILKMLDKVPSYITYFGDLFGEFPFKNEKYGHAEWLIRGGMEHSTISFIGHSSWSDILLIHELAHHWFGDQITCATWSDIWLNEGFATYAEVLIFEKEAATNKEPYNNWFKDKAIRILDEGKEGSVYNPAPDNYERTFSPVLTYRKGGMILHQLRNVVGDDIFFKSIRTFLEEQQFNFATTEDFRQSLIKSTGVDLTEFFNDWIYGEGYPVFDLTVTNKAIGDVSLKVDQTQTHPSVSFFETPFKVKFIGESEQAIIKEFNLAYNHQTFHITDIPFEIKEIVFNPYFDIIAKENKISLSNETIKMENRVKIEMNPISGLLNISSSEIIKGIQLFDISGKLIESIKGGHTFYSIQTSGWQTGIYLVKVESKEGLISKKIRK